LKDIEIDEKLPEKIIPEPHIFRNDQGKWVKQVVFQSSSHVRPGEMVAIMGPSGSGKTSLLNVISQRTALSSKSYFTGEISINGSTLKPKDFGKVGAFVQ